jgi:hypothetical protein
VRQVRAFPFLKFRSERNQMKNLMKIAGGLFVLIGFIALFNLLHAQDAAMSDATAVQTAAPDSIVRLKAESLGLSLVPTENLPASGTFWLVSTDGVFSPYPCPPPDADSLPIYSITTNGQYLVDATDGRVDTEGGASVQDALASLADEVGNLISQIQEPPAGRTMARMSGMAGMMTMDDVDLNPEDGGDDTNDDGGYTNSFQFTPINTNGLWLQIFSVSNGVAYLSLNNATDQVYEVMSRTNLISPGWQIETELFPGTNTNSMPFTVPELDRTNALFFLAMDWTGITSGGNTAPDWWLWEYFGTTNLSDTNLDSGGDTLLYDYQNGIDPNVIEFSLQFTNDTISASPANGSVTISGGTPFYEAILLNDTNTADAVWQPYASTNVAVPLNWGNGLYTVTVGLRGLPTNAAQTWLEVQLNFNNLAPVLTVTNPTASTISTPLIQLQGLVGASLSSLTYDVSNAAGIFTNQTGYWNPVFYDTNLLTFTTNAFQCYDVQLTNGLNTITLHATDLAGNTTTTNVSYTLDYSGDHTAPVLNVVWPTNGTCISGSNFTLQAQMDDATATVTASIVDTNGDTNIVQGLVERSGNVWLDDVPLSIGTNVLTVTATDGAGNSTTTNLTLVQSGVLVTMDPLSSGQFNQSSVNVTGTINDTNSTYDIYVNGVEAYYTDDEGDWEADGVPVSPTGTATFDVEIYVGDPVNAGSQIISMAQPATVELMSYTKHTQTANVDYNYCSSGPAPYQSDEVVDWLYQSGGADFNSGSGIGGDCTPVSSSGTTSLAGGYNGYSPAWEWNDVNESYDVFHFGQGVGDRGTTDVGGQETDTKTQVMIMPSGQQAIGQTALYLVMAQVMDEDSGEQLAASAIQFLHQVAGTTTQDVTNDDGSVWSQALVSGSAGVPLEITPTTPGNINFSRMKISPSKIIYISVDTSAPAPGVPSTFADNTKDIGSDLGNQLVTKLALPAGSIEAQVHIQSDFKLSLGWNATHNIYVCRVNWVSPLPAGGLSYGENNNVSIDAIACRNYNTGSDPPVQFWVNDLAHEVIWRCIYGGEDRDISPPAGEISSGLEPPFPLTDEFTINPANQVKLCTTFGF